MLRLCCAICCFDTLSAPLLILCCKEKCASVKYISNRGSIPCNTINRLNKATSFEFDQLLSMYNVLPQYQTAREGSLLQVMTSVS